MAILDSLCVLGRCFQFWQEFSKCHVQSSVDGSCSNEFEDYQECLFHKKEFLRLKIVKDEWKKTGAGAEGGAAGATANH